MPHHVTAIASDALRNFTFFSQTLGLRLVKRTADFDDPGTYRVHYGDETEKQGTIFTFFPWEQAVKGRVGIGDAQQTSFRVPARSLGCWTLRFVEKAVEHRTLERRFGESLLTFTDPDSLALVGVPDGENDTARSNGPWPARHDAVAR